MSEDRYCVKQITRNEASHWILKKHYAKRMHPISYSFGLYKNSMYDSEFTEKNVALIRADMQKEKRDAESTRARSNT